MIRNRLKQVLDSRSDMNMAKLSRRADLSYNTIQTLCKDPYHDVNLGTLQKIADALHLSVFDLLEEVSPQDISEVSR